ncbi:MCP-domain signal transduction protein [Malaciobacter molluscorum LMG 25693]|uniref:MCP-domain signal transduction protein n=3 Tax=Malaciobacter molluscorum LMG 25693 TaxID=870501 RepID=A0AB33H0C6_9BACT|nr:methyl-accepting chemotaxis protein [Malaciobacter molluscorum]AXX92774.1 MCP-domain signal transduction protein [Malaciobacter molluscorum LMG 25693]
MSIKNKFLGLSICVLAAIFSILFVNLHSISNLNKLTEARTLVASLKSDQLILRKYEKDFFSRKNLSYKQDFITTFQEMEKQLSHLNKILVEFGISLKFTKNFDKTMIDYKKLFLEIVELDTKKGLTPKTGLYGSLRNSVHKVQDYAKKSGNYKLLSFVYELRKEEKDFMLRLDEKYITRFKTKIDNLISTVTNEQMKSDLISYKKDFLALASSEVNKGLDEQNGLLNELRQTIHATEKSIKELENKLEEKIKKQNKETKVISIALTSFVVVFMIVVLFFIGKNIVGNLQKFEKGLLTFFKYINREVSSVEPLSIKGKDEFAQMADTINENIKKINEGLQLDNKAVSDALEVVEEIKKGHIDIQLETIANNPQLVQLKDALNMMLLNIKTNMDSVSKLLKEFSNYKFVNKVSTNNVEGYMLEFINNVNFLTDEISGLLKNSLTIGVTLDKASDTLLANVDILNKSSNEAAASLEETAAALEEITSTIISSSENIEKMSSNAEYLINSAKTGQTLANKTTVAMDEINNQVNSIEEAITVIDQIAFQTNILSLNAAVEAATAGEAGKGFAVVAQEVRNLASRSADAAKEIKELVENATTKANEGKNISAEMIQGYDKLLENIESSNKMIEEIANASKEQESGITQINDAVTHLDQQTQQNASIATQTHEIAEETDVIAKKIVSDANAKEFLGKDRIEIKEGKQQNTNNNSTQIKQDSKDKKIEKEEKSKRENKVITSQQDSDDEWESF